MGIPAHMKYREELVAPTRSRMSPLSMIFTGVAAGLAVFGLAWAFGLVH